MPLDSIKAIFHAKKIIRESRVTTREFTILTAIKLMDSGQSIQAVQRYCEANGHCWHYWDFSKLINKLKAEGLVNKTGRQVHLTDKGLLLVSSVDRRIKKVQLMA